MRIRCPKPLDEGANLPHFNKLYSWSPIFWQLTLASSTDLNYNVPVISCALDMAKISRLPKSVKNIYVTQKGLTEAQEELDFLKTTKRAEIAERIQRAREFGDISENSEYDAALDEQALVEHRISYLEEVLKNAKVITETEKSDFVVIGSTVSVEMDGEIDEFMIVGRVEANPAKKRISNESPVGQALLGAKVGEEVEVATPIVHYKVKVLKIK